MDWGRAKNIILVVLVVTNIFLIGVYGLRYESSRENNSELYNYTIDKLEANQIELTCDIPENPGRIPTLTVQYAEYDKNTVERVLRADEFSGKTAESREEYEAAAEEFLRACGLLSYGAGIADFIREKDGTAIVRYENRYEDMPLAECYMDVRFKDGRVADLDYQWMEPVEEGSAKLSITEPVTALLRFVDIVNEERNAEVLSEQDGDFTGETTKNMSGVPNPLLRKGGQSPGEDTEEKPADNSGQNQKPKTVKVEAINLVYYVNKDDVSGNILYDTAFPAWRIQYDGGRIKYISAFEQ